MNSEKMLTLTWLLVIPNACEGPLKPPHAPYN